MLSFCKMKILTVGRGEECDVIVSDPKISRVHVQIIIDNQGICSVVDLGSTNGTFVNGKRIVNETRLNDSDQVRIGDTVLPWKSYVESESYQKKKVRWKWNLVIISSFVGVLLLSLFFIYDGNRKKKENGKEQQLIEFKKSAERVKSFQDRKDAMDQSYVEVLESRDSISREYAEKMKVTAKEYENRAVKAEEAHEKERYSRAKAEKERKESDKLRMEAERSEQKIRKQLEREKKEKERVQKDLSEKESELQVTKEQLMLMMKDQFQLLLEQTTSRQIVSVLSSMKNEKLVQKQDSKALLTKIFDEAYGNSDFEMMKKILFTMQREVSRIEENRAVDTVAYIGSDI